MTKPKKIECPEGGALVTGFQDSYGIKDKTIKAGVARLERAKDDDLFEAAFGDHVMVIATPEGFHINEYSHD